MKELAIRDPRELLSPPALTFIRDLARRFQPGLAGLLAERERRQAGFDRGLPPGLPAGTEGIREGAWRVAPPPRSFMDRRVELTGPPATATVVQTLDSGARAFLADFEDGLAPTLDNLLDGQWQVLRAAGGPAAPMVRPRGLHLLEHRLPGAEPVPACLFDVGLFLFHGARTLLERDQEPCLWLAKLEHHLEARWWNTVLEAMERRLDLPVGCIRTTMLIETLPAAFQMEELLFEQRERAVGMQFGQVNYLSSYIKTLRADPRAMLPDRAALHMDQPFLRACSQLLVRTCHRRGTLALGGAGITGTASGRTEEAAPVAAQVRAEALREVLDGYDGTLVGDPALVAVARAEFDLRMPGLNQAHRMPGPVRDQDLLETPAGPRTEGGLRLELRVALRCLEAWLRGQGRAVLYGRLEDAAGVEFTRLHLWQWLSREAEVAGLGRLERPLFHCHVEDALHQVQAEVGEDAFQEGRYLEAADLLETAILLRDPPAFLTPAAEGLLAEIPR